jgi:FkbM family methyltransferase
MAHPEPRSRPPRLFLLGRRLERRGVHGSSFFLRALKRLGVLHRPVVLPIGKAINVEVLLDRLPWDAEDLAVYENGYIEELASIARTFPSPVTLVDVGADIGLFALKLISACPAIQSLFAFEPNPEGFALLKKNLEQLPFPAQAIPKGVADFEGRGTLVSPDHGMDFAANFMQRSENGKIAMTTMDSLSIRNANLCLKIDVEGGELAVLRGAEQTIRSAHSIVVGLEAHPAVVKRTGVDPVECLRLLQSWRQFSFFVSETKTKLEITRPVFAQIPDTQLYNVIGVSSL